LCESDCVMTTVRKAVTKTRCCGEFCAEFNTIPHSDVCVRKPSFFGKALFLKRPVLSEQIQSK